MYFIEITKEDGSIFLLEVETERIELKYGNADFSEVYTFETVDHIIPEAVVPEGTQTLFEAEGLNEDGTEIAPDNG